MTQTYRCILCVYGKSFMAWRGLSSTLNLSSPLSVSLFSVMLSQQPALCLSAEFSQVMLQPMCLCDGDSTLQIFLFLIYYSVPFHLLISPFFPRFLPHFCQAASVMHSVTCLLSSLCLSLPSSSALTPKQMLLKRRSPPSHPTSSFN